MSVEEETNRFIDLFFPGKFSQIIYSKNPYLRHKDGESKGKICRDEGVSVCIEDSIDYAWDCYQHRIRVLLFNRPWNDGRIDPPGIQRVDSWYEVPKKIELLLN